MTTVTIEEPLCLANFSVFPTSLGRKSDKKKSKKQATKQLATSTDSAPIAVTESCLFGASWSASLATTNDTAVATLDDSIDASTNTLDERAVPLAIQGEGVQFYQADEHQRCLKSWSTGPAVHFCTPPIYVKSAKNVNFVYIGVQQAADITEEKAGRTIWRWIDGEAGAMRSKRTYSVPQPIIALNSVPWASNRLVVLQADGTILLTNEELKVITHSPLKNKNNAFIIQYAVTPIADTFLPVSVLSEMNAAQTLLISIITATPNDTSCLIHWITVDTQTEEVKDIGSTPIKMDHPLVNCALDLKHGGLTVADISGKWTAYTCVFDTAGFHAKSLSSAQLDQIVGLTSETKPLTFTTRPIAVAYVRQDYIACIYRHQVSKDKLEHSLTVWDTRFGTKQAEQALPVEASTDDQCLYKACMTPWSQLLVSVAVSSKNLSAEKTSLFGLKISCRSISLLGAIGRLSISSTHIATSTVSNDAVLPYNQMAAITGVPKDPIVLDKWTSLQTKTQATEHELLAKLLESNISADQFSQIYTAYFEKDEDANKLRAKIANYEQELDGLKEVKASLIVEDELTDLAKKIKKIYAKLDRLKNKLRQSPQEPKLSQPFVATVIARCFRECSDGSADLSFWPVSVVEDIMRRGLLSAGYVRSNRHGDSTLLRRLADRQAWHLVLLAFRHVGDLSEIDAVSVLRRLCDKQLSNTNNTDMDYDSTDNAPIRVDELLAAFMATPTNSSLLVRAFHRLSTAHTLLVLGIIVQWMRHWSEAVANDKPTAALLSSSLPPPRLDAAFLPTPYLPLNGRTAPSQTLVIDTAALLLDAHLARLILTPEARPLLRELQQLVKAELELQRSCEILRGMLGGYWLRSLMPSAKEFSTHGLGKEATSAEAARIKGQLAAQSRKPARHGRKQAQKMARSARAGIYGLEVLQFEV